jgi:hypothetical protein
MGNPLRRPRQKQEGNIKTNLAETAWVGIDYIHLAHDRG